MSKNLWVVGDSTLISFEDKYYLPRYGYGTKLQEYLDDEFIVKILHFQEEAARVIQQNLNIRHYFQE